MDTNVLRPNYLAIYLHGKGCICTIIEMKGRDSKNLKHGLDQIKSLADRLKAEFEEHLPARFELTVQGILLCPVNAQVPAPQIQKMAAGKLIVLPAQCNNHAELYPYISRENKLIDRFENRVQSPCQPSPIEEMMSQGTLKKRLPDRLTDARPGAGAGTGLHINFALSDTDEYATLITRGKKCVFVVKEQGNEHQQRLLQDITNNSLNNKFDVERMPE